MENRTKTNDQLFTDYYNLLLTSHSKRYNYEARRILEKFRAFLGEFPPTLDLGVQYFTRYKDLKPNSRSRYAFAMSAFFKWYSGEKFPIKIRTPKILPQYVQDADIERLKVFIKSRKSHKKIIERDLLIIETAQYTGLRRSELANLKAGDLVLNDKDPILIVRGGKGYKDRSVNLIQSLAERLANFARGKGPDESVFNLTASSISMKITVWAKKAGVPHIHLHSFRHNFATDLFEKNANPRAVQELMGHESLETTMRYSEVTGQHLRNTVNLLQKNPEVNGSKSWTPDPKEQGVQSNIYVDTPTKLKIREAARTLASGINLPSHWDTDLWKNLPVDFLPGEYFLPIGTVEIASDKHIKVTYHELSAGVAEPHLIKGLYSHLNTSEIPGFTELVGKLDNLVAGIEKYSQMLMEFLKLISDEVDKSGVEVSFNDGNKPGLKKWFIVTIWQDALSKTPTYNWINEAWYAITEHEASLNLWQLKCGRENIGIARNKATLLVYENLHKTLRRSYSEHLLVKDINALDQELRNASQEIKQLLHEFSDMEPLPGHCGLC